MAKLHSPGRGSFTYSIFEGMLVGAAGGRQFMIHARAGGGGGSTKGKAEPEIVNNPYMQMRTTNAAKQVRGGPIPIGKYTIHHSGQHHKLGRSCLLEEASKRQLGNRTGGFYIHGQGRLGSDGCIVPLMQLTELLDAIDKDGGGTLFVLEGFGGVMFG